MLKHFAFGVLGFAALIGTVGSAAAADKGGHYWFNRTLFPYPYVYNDKSTKSVTRKSQFRSKANSRLDVETEAVHRNLRPTWFD